MIKRWDWILLILEMNQITVIQLDAMMRVKKGHDNKKVENEKDQEKNRDHQVPGGFRRILSGVVLSFSFEFTSLALAFATVVAFVDSRLALGNKHGAKVTTRVDEENNQKDHKDWVVTILDALEEDAKSARLDTQITSAFERDNAVELLLDKTDFKANPARNRRDTGNGSCRGVHNECELFTGDKEHIQKRTHRLARQKDVGVVVEKDETSNSKAGKLTQAWGGRNGSDILGESTHSATPLHHTHHTAQKEGKQNDVNMAHVGNRVEDVRVKCALETGIDVSSNHAGTNQNGAKEGEFHHVGGHG